MHALPSSAEPPVFRIFIPGQRTYERAARPFRRRGECTLVSLPVIIHGKEYRKIIFTRAALGFKNTGELRGTIVLDRDGSPVIDPVLVKAVCQATVAYWENDRAALHRNAQDLRPDVLAFEQTWVRVLAEVDGWADRPPLVALLDVWRSHVRTAEESIPLDRELLARLQQIDARSCLTDADVHQIAELSVAARRYADEQQTAYLAGEAVARACLEQLATLDRSVVRRLHAVDPQFLTHLRDFASYVVEQAMELRATGPRHLATWERHLRERTQEGLSTHRLPLAMSTYDDIPDLALPDGSGAPGEPDGPPALTASEPAGVRPRRRFDWGLLALIVGVVGGSVLLVPVLAERGLLPYFHWTAVAVIMLSGVAARLMRGS